MPAKGWPAYNKTEELDRLIKPITEAFNFGYEVKRKNKGKDVPYNGFGFGKLSAVCTLPPEVLLEESSLKYHRQRDRELIDILFQIAFNLGIEQGRRLIEKNLASKLDNSLALLKEVVGFLEEAKRQ